MLESRPLLQIALDRVDGNEALHIADAVQRYVDILGIGTALLKKEGIKIVEAIKQRYPDKLVCADTKTIDFGQTEACMVFDAGADMMSVCAVAADATIDLVLREARKRGKRVLIDLIGTGDSYRQIKRLSLLEPDYIIVHTGVDERFAANDLFEKVEIVSQISPIPLAIAGGIELDDMPYLQIFHPAIVIVGSAIHSSSQPVSVAQHFWESLQHASDSLLDDW